MRSPERQPPRAPGWADRFLEWYCRPELLEEIQGDVYELFEKRSREKSPKVARLHFVWDVLRSFRLSTIRHFNFNISPMFSITHFKIALRQLLKQKLYSAIKIGGFAIGIAACILIGLFIRDELRYDLHWPDADRIYRVVGQFNDEGEISKGIDFPAPFAKAVTADYPEVETAGRMNPNELFTGAGSNLIRPAGTEENTFETGFTYADQAILDIFGVPMVYGDRKQALDKPNTLVLSRTKAEKYFPGENPVGKVLILNNDETAPYTIGGVMEDFPDNAHLDYDFFLTLTGKSFWPGEQETWMANNYTTYVVLRPGADVPKLEKDLKSVITRYLIPVLQQQGSQEIEKIEKGGSFLLQPVTDIHLRSYDIDDDLLHGDIRFVWLFGAVAGFILLIACINFINLSTARSANRAMEVGLRKVVGSQKSHLIGQFLAESVLYSLLSFVVGILLAWALLPFFNTLSGKSLVFPWTEWWPAPVVVLAALATGMLAGLYPAFYLSAFRPIQVLKGQLSRGVKGVALRSGLVVFQFTTSIVLIIGTFIIYRQMGYILHKKLGFEKEQVLMLQGANTLGDQVLSFKQELLKLPEVKNATVSDYLPVSGMKRNGNGFWKEGRIREDSPVYGQLWQVDHDYISTLGMKIVAGRDFSIDMPTDSQSLVINQAMAKELGLEDPVGKRITNGGAPYPVIGVLEDFHSESMEKKIEPLCMVIGASPSVVSVKAGTDDLPGLIRDISGVWKKFAPHQPVRYAFLDESFAKMYANVKRTGAIFTSFALLAIVVACLGLFALSAFMAEQRSKEMGIRKVLGAPVRSIFRLLTQHFLILVLISFTIAVPLAWYLMQKWLQDFEYRTDITWEVFVLAGVTAVFIAVLTVSLQAGKAALANPVAALKTE